MNYRWTTIGWMTLLITAIAGVVQILYFFPQLPAEVASHFDGQGNVNGSMSKSAFTAFFIGLEIGMGLLFLCIAPLIKILPISLVNIPNREYWLSEPRRKESIDSIAGFSYWIGVITILLMMIIFQLTVLANIQKANLNGTVFWITLIVYLLLIFVSSAWLFVRFRLPIATK